MPTQPKEFLFFHNSDFRDVIGRADDIHLELITPPSVEPLSVAEAKESLRIGTTTRHDALLNRIIPLARRLIEGTTGQAMIEQVWRQTHDLPGNPVKLFIKPVSEIVHVKYYPTMESTTQETVSADRYFFSGQQLVHRTTWPAFRLVKGFEVQYKAGYSDTASGFETNASASTLKHALDMLVAYLFENPGDMVKFERGISESGSGSSAVRSLPPEVLAIIEMNTEYEL